MPAVPATGSSESSLCLDIGMKYRVLELFSGSGSLTRFCTQMPELFETVRLDIDPRTDPDILVSILDWDYTRESHFDII